MRKESPRKGKTQAEKKGRGSPLPPQERYNNEGGEEGGKYDRRGTRHRKGMCSWGGEDEETHKRTREHRTKIGGVGI